MPTLVSDIVNDVITELAQVPGKSVQLYAVPRITQHIQDAILLEIEEIWWPDYMTYCSTSLDGTTGRLTDDLTGPLGPITEYHDVAVVWIKGTNRRIPEVPYGQNPGVLASNGSLFMCPDYKLPNRPFRIFPADAVSDIVAWARQRPKIPISTTDYVHMDRLLLTFDAAWMYCVDDGTIPAQVNKFQMLAAKRRKQMISAFAAQPIMLNPGDTSGTDQWWMVP